MSSYGTITVADTATLITAANTSRREIDIVNTSSTVIMYIGQDDSVTTSNGFPVYPRQNRARSKMFTDWMGPVYGIVSSGTVDARYWETTQQ